MLFLVTTDISVVCNMKITAIGLLLLAKYTLQQSFSKYIVCASIGTYNAIASCKINQLCFVKNHYACSTAALDQPATGPSTTCQGNDVRVQCVILRNGVPVDLPI